MRVRLNMTTEPELLRIPWEFLRLNGKDLAGQRDCTIVRELVTAEPARPQLVEGKIRMLGVIANPNGDLDVAGEKQRVTEALEKCKDQVDLEWVEDCTFRSLQRKLQDPFHILHFVGHSAFTGRTDIAGAFTGFRTATPPAATTSSTGRRWPTASTLSAG